MTQQLIEFDLPKVDISFLIPPSFIRKIEVKLHRTYEIVDLIYSHIDKKEKAILITTMNVNVAILRMLASKHITTLMYVLTNSSSISKYVKKAIKTTSLHYKYIVFDSMIVVTSANLSNSPFLESTLLLKLEKGTNIPKQFASYIINNTNYCLKHSVLQETET